MTSDRQLKNQFASFNRKYFGGLLPENTVLIYEPVPKCDGVTCPVFEVADGCFEIKIDPALKGSPCYWRIVLLHEMAHVAVWPRHPKHQHGKTFRDEISRLFAMGAYTKLL
jgi:hypothetical protein